MPKIHQILWVIGLNIASYIIIEVFEKIIAKSPKLPQRFLQYFDVNPYYAIFVAVLNIGILYFILRRNKKSDVYQKVYDNFFDHINNAITRYRGFSSNLSSERKYTEVGVREMINEVSKSRMKLLFVCGKPVKSFLEELGTEWLNDMESFYNKAPSIVQKLPEIAYKDRI